MDNLTIAIIQTAMKQMFRSDRHFSICTFNDICKVANIIPQPGVRDKLNLLHCVNYTDMTKEVREGLMDMVKETFDHPGFDFELFQDDNRIVHLEKRKGFKLFGKKGE